MAKRRTNQPQLSAELIRNIGISVIVVIALVFVVREFLSLVNRSPLFLIREIAVADSIGKLDIPEFEKLKGRNIFAVNLDKFEAKIKSRYPALSNVRVTRRFPNQVFISAFKREPFARAALGGRMFVIDQDGYLIGTSTDETVSLTLVKGLHAAKVAVGEAVGDKELPVAVEIIRRFKSDRVLSAIPLRSIDVEDSGRIVCVVGEESKGIDVILDAKNAADRIGELGVLISHGDVDAAAIKYVDLRFDEPIIGQKKTRK